MCREGQYCMACFEMRRSLASLIALHVSISSLASEIPLLLKRRWLDASSKDALIAALLD